MEEKRQVIHIYGASGSGTSTLGKTISDRLGYQKEGKRMKDNTSVFNAKEYDEKIKKVCFL